MTWEIVTGILALVGGFVTLMGVVVKVNGTMARLDATMKLVQEAIKEFKTSSHATHKKLFEKIDDHEHTLNDHESRIKILEDHDKEEKT